MKGSFTDIIQSSIEWTNTVLFRRFSLKKWMLLYVIAFFAFQMHGGCNLNIKTSPPKAREAARAQAMQSKTKIASIRGAFKRAAAGKERRIIRPFIFLLGAAVIVFFLLLEWLYSMFSFVFIDSVVNNDASIKEPFKRNRALGNSYFAWNIICIIVFLSACFVLAKSGYDSLSRLGMFNGGTVPPFGRTVSTLLPYILTAACLFFAGAVLSVFVNDYVLVVMFKQRLPILRAIAPSFSLLCSDKAAFVKYLFVRAGLFIATFILGGMITFLVIICLLIPIGAAALILIFLFKIIPVSLHVVFAVAAAVIGAPLILILIFFISSILLPFSVFHKTFNIKFISRVDDRYNLFKLSK